MGRRLTPYERRQREREREERAAARRRRTAERRAAEKRERDRKSAADSRRAKQLDSDYTDAMNAITNLHIEDKHPYLYLGSKSAKALTGVDMTPAMKLTPFIPKKTPPFTEHKKEIKKHYSDDQNKYKLHEDMTNQKLYESLEMYFINTIKELSTSKLRKNKKG